MADHNTVAENKKRIDFTFGVIGFLVFFSMPILKAIGILDVPSVVAWFPVIIALTLGALVFVLVAIAFLWIALVESIFDKWPDRNGEEDNSHAV